MPDPINDALADLQKSIARTIALICRQLIDGGALNEELLTADLTALRVTFDLEGISQPGASFPLALLAVLKRPPEQQR